MPDQTPAQSVCEPEYVEGTAWWVCAGCDHEWSSDAREYPPESEHDCHMVTAEERGDDCPKCGRTDADSIDFEGWR